MSAASMSLREQEQTVARLRIVLQTIPPNHFLFEITLSIFLFLREQNQEIYLSLIEGKTDVETILSYVERLPRISEVFKDLDQELIEAFLLAGLAELDVFSPRLEEYQRLANSDSDEQNVAKAQSILRIIRHISNKFDSRGAGFKITAQRLALTSSFVTYDE